MPIIAAPTPRGDFGHFNESSPQRSRRDSDATGVQWQKNGQTTDQVRQLQNAVSYLSRTAGRQRPRIIGMPQNETPQQTIFPFVIYNIQNVSATDAQKAQFTTAGLDINQFTFQIRSGLVSLRSPYFTDTSVLFGTLGNFEQIILAQCTDNPPYDSDFSYTGQEFFYPIAANEGTCTVLDNINPTLLVGALPATPTDYVFSNQIALYPSFAGMDQFTACSAGFWLEIIDGSTNGGYAYVNLWGQMYESEDPGGRVTNPFPSGDNIVPLGWVSVYPAASDGNPPYAVYEFNFQTDNLVNRFSPQSSAFRGVWNALYAALPAGYTELAFYPGDIVVDDSASFMTLSGGQNVFGVYTLIYGPLVTNSFDNPSSDPTHWQLTGMIPAP